MASQWKPNLWLGILIAIILRPFVFLYLNKQKIFWMYALFSTILALFDIYYKTNYSYIINGVCAIQAIYVVRHYDVNTKRAWYSKWWGIPFIFALLLVFCFTLKSIFFETYNIPTSSMNPNFNMGQTIIVKKWGYGNYGTYGITIFNKGLATEKMIHRGGVYVFYPPTSNQIYIKRVIGLPGDQLEFSNKQLKVNGNLIETINTEIKFQLLEQLDLEKYCVQYKLDDNEHRDFSITVPEKSYFLMGDNRDSAIDSREWGTITIDKFIGEVIFVFGKASAKGIQN